MPEDEYPSDSTPSHSSAPQKKSSHSTYYHDTKRNILEIARSWGGPWETAYLKLHSQKYKIELFGKSSHYEYWVELGQRSENGSVGDNFKYHKKKDDALRYLWKLVVRKDSKVKEKWKRERLDEERREVERVGERREVEQGRDRRKEGGEEVEVEAARAAWRPSDRGSRDGGRWE